MNLILKLLLLFVISNASIGCERSLIVNSQHADTLDNTKTVVKSKNEKDSLFVERYDSLIFQSVNDFVLDFDKNLRPELDIDSIRLVNNPYTELVDTIFNYSLEKSFFQFYQSSFDNKFLLGYLESTDLNLLQKLYSSYNEISQEILAKNEDYSYYVLTVYVEGYTLTIELDNEGNLIIFELYGLLI